MTWPCARNCIRIQRLTTAKYVGNALLWSAKSGITTVVQMGRSTTLQQNTADSAPGLSTKVPSHATVKGPPNAPLLTTCSNQRAMAHTPSATLVSKRCQVADFATRQIRVSSAKALSSSTNSKEGTAAPITAAGSAVPTASSAPPRRSAPSAIPSTI